jgi:SAM-dependent methyltransferase
VLDQRRQALQQCLRVLRPGGALLLSVMSLWGTVHAFLPGVLAIPAGFNREIVRTGDLTPATLPERKDNFMHLFRASELRQWLQDAGLTVEAMSASGCLSPTWSEALKPIRGNAEAWKELLDMELEASAQPGCLDMGTHLVAAARKGIG